MLIIKTVNELQEVLFRIKSNGKSIGLVPTMGALHQGHLSLIEKARIENEVVVCSIFVNPVQFNNQDDLQKYPRTLEEDVKLIQNNVDIIFAPTAEEVFPEPPQEKYNFGTLENVMEGAFRPGHFNGVAIIVNRLFSWINPDKAYFGEKDYQQLIIIQNLVKQKGLNIQIVPCPIVRESSGLALSSRNKRLNEADRQTAAKIHLILDESTKCATLAEAKTYVETQISNIPDFTLDYYAIVDAQSLQAINNFEDSESIIGCIAVYISNVRLIDNIKYKN